MAENVFGKVIGKIIIPQEVLAKVNGTISRGVKEINLSEDGDLYFILTDNSTAFLGNIKGAQGIPGKNGFSPTLEIVSIEGGTRVIITDINGNKTFDIPDGKEGSEGKPGEPGKTPNIQIGEVVTLEPGTEATASITGTAEEPRLNLGIPKGEPGEGGEGGNAEVSAENIKNALGYIPADEEDLRDVEVQKMDGVTFVRVFSPITGETYSSADIYDGKDGEVTVLSIVNALGYVPANPKDIPTVPTKVSAFDNDAGYAKRTELPTKTSDLTNDSGFITAKDIPAPPEVPVKSVNGKTGAVQLNAADVGAKPESYSPTYEDVGADKAGKAVEEVSKHNVDPDSHNDIRVKLSELQAAIEAFLDIDDPTFDQLSELIQKIEANAGTIEQLTNGKVNVADIVNNLTTNVANKPLSAAQGVVLKGLVDSLTTVANNATTKAETAKTTADEAKNLATTANTNAKNAVDTVNNMQERMDNGEFKGEPGTPGTSGADGVSVVSVEQTTTSSADGGENVVTVTLSNGTKSTFKIKNGSKGSAGEKGNGIKSAVLNADYTLTLTFDDGTTYTTPSIRGAQGPKGDTYELTGTDKSDIAEMVDGATIVQAPKYVDNTDDMTDQSRVYVLKETGHIWAYMDTTVEQEVTVRDDITEGYETGRLSSGGALSNDVNTHTLTPFIDLTKYAGRKIELHLTGNRYVSESNETYIQFAIYKADKSVINGRSATCLDKAYSILPTVTNVTTVINGTTDAVLTINTPAKYNGNEIGFFRFCGLGTVKSGVYITYKEMQTVTGGQWVDTGTTYAPALTDEDKQEIAEDVAAMIDTQLLDVIGNGVVV